MGGSLEPLFPKTFFRKENAGAGFVVVVDVTMAKVAPGAIASLEMRAFTSDGLYEGRSKVFNVTLGGGSNPPANLLGLEAFSVSYIPEPSTIVIVIMGMVWFLAFHQRK
jgi:hypothetical protein